MELTLRFDAVAKLRVQTLSGDVTADELHEAVEEVYQHAEFNVDHNFLWDFRDCDLRNVPTDMVREFARFVTGKWSARGLPPKGAVVVSRDLEFGLARLFATHIDGGSEFKVFRDVTEATVWLSTRTQ